MNSLPRSGHLQPETDKRAPAIDLSCCRADALATIFADRIALALRNADRVSLPIRTSWFAKIGVRRLSASLCGLVLAVSTPSGAVAAGWPDTDVGRLEAMVELQTLNVALLSHPSATLTLDRWCARHKLADKPLVVADRSVRVKKAPDEETRRLLGATADETVGYRHVRLRCGDRVLSEADNWYLPSKLTPEMNRLLETSDMAFGRVVQPLGFRRQIHDAKLLWSPLDRDAVTGRVVTSGVRKRRVLTIPSDVLEHRALLTRADGVPFSFVVERYTDAVLDFPPAIAR